jgi:hypothetical protein
MIYIKILSVMVDVLFPWKGMKYKTEIKDIHLSTQMSSQQVVKKYELHTFEN